MTGPAAAKHDPFPGFTDGLDRAAASARQLPTPLGPLHIKQGKNQYEWHVYEGSVSLSTWPTKNEAMAFMAGYEKGHDA